MQKSAPRFAVPILDILITGAVMYGGSVFRQHPKSFLVTTAHPDALANVGFNAGWTAKLWEVACASPTHNEGTWLMRI